MSHGLGPQPSSLRERGIAVGSVLLLTLGAIVLGVATLFAGAFILGLLSIQLTPLRETLLSLAALQGVGFIGGGLLYLRWRGAPEIPISMLSRRELGLIGVGWAAMIGANIASGILTQLVNIDVPESGITDLINGDPMIILILFVASFLIIGPGEDFFFRGIVQGRLRETFGPKGAIAIATVVFGLIHVTNFTGSPVSVAAAVGRLILVSVTLGALYEYTDNLVVPVGVHAVYNATLFGVLYIATLYDVEPAFILV